MADFDADGERAGDLKSDLYDTDSYSYSEKSIKESKGSKQLAWEIDVDLLEGDGVGEEDILGVDQWELMMLMFVVCGLWYGVDGKLVTDEEAGGKKAEIRFRFRSEGDAWPDIRCLFEVPFLRASVSENAQQQLARIQIIPSYR